MNTSQQIQLDDSENLSESDSSEATVESSDEWPDEQDFETAVVLDQKFRLPKELCENPEIFNELFSISTWNQLSDDEKAHLSNFLPSKFPENQAQEKQNTVEQLFRNEFSRFGETPLNTFFNNLQDGNYRPDIAHYRKQIFRAEAREQQIRECERVSALAEHLVVSREKLLLSAYKQPVESKPPEKLHMPADLAELSGPTAKAKKRSVEEIVKIAVDLNKTLSDEEEAEMLVDYYQVILIN